MSNKYIIEPIDHDIKVLTYNVGWESLESFNSSKLDMSHCKESNINQNKCTINIAHIICQLGINKISKPDCKYLYDFVFLQEIVNSENQWACLEKEINKLEPDFLKNFNIEYTEDLPAGIITLYNKNYYHLIYKLQGKLLEHDLLADHRPWQILVFEENIIVINIHFPHLVNYQEEALKILKHNIKKVKELVGDKFSNYNFILGGDFNNGDPSQLQNFPLLLTEFKKLFYAEPTKLLTCCVPHDFPTYDKSFDHIYSSISQANFYQTLDKINSFTNGDLIMMSDHIPVFAIFKYNSINLKSVAKKYLINYF